MQEAYRITDWLKTYEVATKGQVARAGANLGDLKKGPLSYVRFKAAGHKLGPAYRKLMLLAWPKGEAIQQAVIGVFGKLLELAACQDREYRGWILDEKQKPIDAAGIAELVYWDDVSIVDCCLDLLCNERIGWVERVEFQKNAEIYCNFSGVPESSGALAANDPGEPRSLLDETETEQNINKTESENQLTPAGAGDSEFSSNSPTSDSGSPFTASLKNELKLNDILGPLTKSDRTVIKDVLRQMAGAVESGEQTMGIFNVMIDKARACIGADRPMAMFTAAMKKSPVNYQPQRKQIIGSKG